MQWKFQKEEHNRKDKIHKPDYRETFSDPVAQSLSAGALLLRNIRFTKNGVVPTPAMYREAARDWKEKIKREFRRITSKHPFWVTVANQNFRMTFKWTSVEFCVNNSLDPQSSASQVLFQRSRDTALELRRMVELRLARAELSKQLDDTTGLTSYTIEFGLGDISHFFKFSDGFCLEERFNPK